MANGLSMLRKTAILTGVLVLAVGSEVRAQERPGTTSATVTARLEVLDPVGQEGPLTVRFEEGTVWLTSEWENAGRVPVVMAAHVQPASVKDRGTAAGLWGEERGERPPAVTSEASKAGSVTRHTIGLKEARGGYRVVRVAAVAL